MKNAPPHTGKWLRECFPEQTKTPTHIVIWTLVFLLDVALVFAVLWLMGVNLLSLNIRLAVCLILAAAFLLFWGEAALYNKILASYRKTLE